MPMVPSAWADHAGFNAYRYGIARYQDVQPTLPTEDEIRAYLEWEALYASMGVPG